MCAKNLCRNIQVGRKDIGYCENLLVLGIVILGS